MAKQKIIITQITASEDGVFGLAKDGLVYIWDTKALIWILYKK